MNKRSESPAPKPISLNVHNENDVSGVLLRQFEDRIDILEKRVSALEKVKTQATQSLPQSKDNPMSREMTVDDYMAGAKAAAPKRFVGQVPFAEDGRIVDPAWSYNEKLRQYERRDLGSPNREIVEIVKA